MLSKGLKKIPVTSLGDVEHVVLPIFSELCEDTKTLLLNKMFSNMSTSAVIRTKVSNFISLSIGAMEVLQEAKKPNLVYKWVQCMSRESGQPLMPLNRMPFGLIEYQLAFFTATNVMQVCLYFSCYFSYCRSAIVSNGDRIRLLQ